jgi:undecaprenyl-diphosphatase
VTPIQAAILGLLQGLTEFLPISSSGHLVLGQKLLGVQTSNVTFEVVLHLGTLLAVVTALRERVLALASGCIRKQPDAWRFVLLLGIGTVPAAAFGLLFKEAFEAVFSRPIVVAALLMVTGLILWSTRFRSGHRERFRVWDAVWIGVSQALAILPGISRSGITIGTGIWRGIIGREAAIFSFLLSIPAILGANLLKAAEIIAHPPGADTLVCFLIGMLTAYAAGVAAIRWLMAILDGGRLDRFAYYCWIVGLIGVVALSVQG